MNMVPQHHSKDLKLKFEHDGDVRFVYLPRRSPYLNMIEEYWGQAKHRLQVSEYYSSFANTRRAVSEYFRVSKSNLDMYAYPDKWAAQCSRIFDLRHRILL